MNEQDDKFEVAMEVVNHAFATKMTLLRRGFHRYAEMGATPEYVAEQRKKLVAEARVILDLLGEMVHQDVVNETMFGRMRNELYAAAEHALAAEKSLADLLKNRATA
jgi:hypothetical protein